MRRSWQLEDSRFFALEKQADWRKEKTLNKAT
jgi:hypothetical protein